MQVTESLPPLHEAQLDTHVDPQAAIPPVHVALPPEELVESDAEASTAPAKWSKSSAHPIDRNATEAMAHASRTSGSYANSASTSNARFVVLEASCAMAADGPGRREPAGATSRVA
jgi:hypothetical protein